MRTNYFDTMKGMADEQFKLDGELQAQLSSDFTKDDYNKVLEYQKHVEDETLRKYARAKARFPVVFGILLLAALMLVYYENQSGYYNILHVKDLKNLVNMTYIVLIILFSLTIVLIMFKTRISAYKKMEQIHSMNKDERIRMYARIAGRDKVDNGVIAKAAQDNAYWNKAANDMKTVRKNLAVYSIIYLIVLLTIFSITILLGFARIWESSIVQEIIFITVTAMMLFSILSIKFRKT